MRRAGTRVSGRISASLRYRARAALRSERVLRALRARATSAGFARDGRSTVVVVNWNTLPYLSVALTAVRRFSNPATTDVIVVDNGSDDGSRAFLRAQHDVRRVLVPMNIEHPAALDVGFLLARSEYVVALDADAFPLSRDWIEQLTLPLRERQVSGVLVNRQYAHPCGMAMRRERFVRERHTFRARFQPQGLGDTAWDCGELISMREWPDVHLIPRSSSRGPGWLGTVWDGVLYHNFYAARHRFEFGEDAPGSLHGITASDARTAWHEAIEDHLGIDDAMHRSLVDRWLEPPSRRRLHRAHARDDRALGRA
jgi:glycosyltransferase involved in cell wall biosynthesis